MARTIDPFAPKVHGNVDLYAQPKVKNPDGSISTVDSASYNLGGAETLLPSVTPDGRHLQADDEIINEYLRTGRHLGQFATPDAASAYAERLHNDYARGRYDVRPTTIDPFTGSKGYQGRTFDEELRGPQTIDPFDDRPAFANAPNMDRSLPAIVNVPIESVPREGLSMPRNRGPAPRVEAPTGRAGRSAPMRAQPVSFGPTLGQSIPNLAAERARYTVPIPLYRGEDARVPAHAMIGQKSPEQVQLSPEQQAIVDAFYDEIDKWTVVDEATGQPRVTGNRVDMNFMDRGTARAIADVEAMDLQRAMELEAARRAAMPKPKVRI